MMLELSGPALSQSGPRLHCDICDADAHLDDATGVTMYSCDWACPKRIAGELLAALRRVQERYCIDCPTCQHGKLAWSISKNFECISCATQFAASGPDLDVTIIDINGDGALIKVRALSEKGCGHFLSAEDHQRLERARGGIDKMQALLRFLREWFGDNEIYFNGKRIISSKSLDAGIRAVLKQSNLQ